MWTWWRRAKFFLPIGAATSERFLNTTRNGFANCVRIPKTHFALGRMDVHIHGAGIELEKKESHRILSFHQRGVITFARRRRDEWTFNRAAVHENQLLGARLPAQAGLPD